MAKGTTSLRPIISLHSLSLSVVTIKQFESMKLPQRETISTVSISCTDWEESQLMGLPIEYYFKNNYHILANSAFDVKVQGLEIDQVYRTFLEQLVEKVRERNSVKFDAGAINA